MIPTLVQNVRKTPFFGNFVAFSSEMWRNSFQINKRALRKLQSLTRAQAELGTETKISASVTLAKRSDAKYVISKCDLKYDVE